MVSLTKKEQLQKEYTHQYYVHFIHMIATVGCIPIPYFQYNLNLTRCVHYESIVLQDPITWLTSDPNSA